MTHNVYHGLPLSDRLNKAGIAISFVKALKAKDVDAMLTLLESVAYSRSAAEATAKTFANNPDCYKG